MRLLLLVALAWPAAPVSKPVAPRSAPVAAVVPGQQAGTNLLPALSVPNLAVPALTPSLTPALVPALKADTPGETSAQLAGLPFDNAGKAQLGDTGSLPVAGFNGPGAPALPPSGGGSNFGGGDGPKPLKFQSEWKGSDRKAFSKIYWTTLHWYTVIHIKNMWPDYLRKREQTSKPSVAKAREFFSWMRAMGQSGPFYVLGFGSLKDELMIAEAKETFDKYFDAGADERAAFERFVERAKGFNAERRNAVNMRKHVRDAMLAASVKPREELVPYFDSLLKEDKAKAVAEYQQSGQAQATLDAFLKLTNELLLEEKPGPSRAIGVTLLGSFANGSPGPASDFDAQLITADGSSERYAAFTKKLVERWGERQAKNPISFHDASYPPSRAVFDRVHNGAYRVITPYEGLAEQLELRPGEPFKLVTKNTLSPSGRLLRLAQYAVVYGVTVNTDLKQGLSDRWHHARLYAQNVWWYTVTHIQGMWPSYMKKRSVVANPSVSKPRRFFARMRVMGQSGPFYVLGFGSRRDEAVIAEAKSEFRRWYDAGPAEEAAFHRFIERAKVYNAERRAHVNMLKHIRDAMIAASLKPREELAPYFDSLLRGDKALALKEFQRSGQALRVLAAFQQAVKDTLAEEDPKDKDAVLGILLLGSFANGSPSPTSDFDVQPLTATGRGKRVADFRRRLLARWGERQAANPIVLQDYPYTPSKGLLDRIHDNVYIIVAADPALAAKLERRPGETLKWERQKELLPAGRFQRALQAFVVYLATYWADLTR